MKDIKSDKKISDKNRQKEIALNHSLKKTKWIIAVLSVLLSISIVLIIFLVQSKKQSKSFQNNGLNSEIINNGTASSGDQPDITNAATTDKAPVDNKTGPDIDKSLTSDNPTTVAQNSSEITFVKEVHDYGAIIKDADGSCEFTFTNTGKEPLVLSNVQSSCGCTVPTWPKDKIMPGTSDIIKVVYDTKKVGVFNKTITVLSNAKNGTVVLTIKGEVTE